MRMPAAFLDSLKVLIFRAEAGPTLVAVIELASLGNPDREAQRHAFSCGRYLC